MTSEPSMASNSRLDSIQISGLAKEMAPMIASIVTRELSDRGWAGGRPFKTTNKRKGQLKNATKLEKEAEDSRARNNFLVSTAHVSY
jgi:hypothetical protein